MRYLNANEPQKVTYCIPLWLRDEQIKVNSARVRARIAASDAITEEPIAIVCYGPSLADTWEELRRFKTVMTCSGAHQFLIERGITPTFHVEVDPREHKVKLIGPPSPDTEYLIASTCHPKVLDHLESYNVKLWHVFEGAEDALRTLPPMEWALLGGCSVGLRAMTVARFLGFVNQHMFGMDGSEGATGKHAAAHPNQPPGHSLCTVDGVDYRTTPAMLEAARGTFHELNQMNDVRPTFYGEGLVQAMAKAWVPKYNDKAKAIIGFTNPELISAGYRSLNQQLHRDNLAFGVNGGRHAATVLKLAETLHTRSVLDYGCGKGYLSKSIPFPIWEYDPAIPGKTEAPRPADLVVCTDVLEHVEPDHLAAVLVDLRRCVRKIGFFVIDTAASSKTLADGRNAHLILKDAAWWRKHLAKFFHVASITNKGRELFVVVAPKAKAPAAQTNRTVKTSVRQEVMA